MLLLERERERNSQKIHGYIKGIGLASNAYHITSPHPEGRGEKAAMEKALQNAALPRKKSTVSLPMGPGQKPMIESSPLPFNRYSANSHPMSVL